MHADEFFLDQRNRLEKFNAECPVHGNRLHQGIHENILQRNPVLHKPVDQLIGNPQPIFRCLGHPFITHAQGHNPAIRSGQQRNHLVIPVGLQGNGIDHGRPLMHRQTGLDGLGIRSVDGTGTFHDGLHRPDKPAHVILFLLQKDPCIDINIVCAGLMFLTRHRLNRLHIPVLDCLRDRLAAGINELSHNDHSDLLLLLFGH